MKKYRTDRLLGWTGVSLSVLFTSLWAFWGIIENFHEGWYFRSLWSNLALMLGQYLIAMFVFMAFALLGLKWPKIGGAVHIIFGCSIPLYFIRNNTGALFIALPMVAVGILYWFGRPEPRIWAYRAVIAIPLIVLLLCGAEPVWRVSGRFNDGMVEARTIQGEGVSLMWAPKGPGWPDDGVSWQQAKEYAAGLAMTESRLGIRPQTYGGCPRSMN